MKLIVGLGNPGSQYERTRHNVGFMALDLFAQKHGAANFRVAHESFLADVLLSGEKLLLLKPQTYMNLSGRAVASAMGFYKLGAADLLVVVDDIALPVGTIRLRAAGSAGGHNGLRDIERAVGGMTSGGAGGGSPGGGGAGGGQKAGQAYNRLRIGVDPPGQVPQRDYVLTAFTPEQKPRLAESLAAAADAIRVWAADGITAAMNRFNGGEKG
jgi:PTH1 family peptidyl-tRNA hydrolase